MHCQISLVAIPLLLWSALQFLRNIPARDWHGSVQQFGCDFYDLVQIPNASVYKNSSSEELVRKSPTKSDSTRTSP
jgi:hypothetical protein